MTGKHYRYRDWETIIITELPYQTNKAALIEKIAELVNDKKIEGISDIVTGKQIGRAHV